VSLGATKVTIVGGGVAALEAMIALRRLAEERVAIELVAPTPEWSYRPLAVAEPFGLGEATRYDLVRIARDHGASMQLSGLESVRPEDHELRTWDGRTFDYELLLIAVGAELTTSLAGSVTVNGPGYTGRFRALLDALEAGRIRHVAFAVPAATSWPLPLYELALMTAARVAELGLRGVELSFVTPEEHPLALFGAAASEAVRTLLTDRGIQLLTGCRPAVVYDGHLAIEPGGSVPSDRVVSLPELRGPFLPGLPHDHEGFIPTDPHGLVGGESDVYAAGDATNFPIKQGGLATQQADAAAEAIAARAGAGVDPTPFHPVLRGLLLTGSAPRYLRADLSEPPDPSNASEHALWWPPSKIAGRWLAPYLALNNDELKAPDGVAIEADLTAIRLHSILARERGSA
jgi:sulfide:quinone oxidoreductase